MVGILTFFLQGVNQNSPKLQGVKHINPLVYCCSSSFLLFYMFWFVFFFFYSRRFWFMSPSFCFFYLYLYILRCCSWRSYCTLLLKKKKKKLLTANNQIFFSWSYQTIWILDQNFVLIKNKNCFKILIVWSRFNGSVFYSADNCI